MTNNITRPNVGVGILVFNDKGQILLSKRISPHGRGLYGPPGGHLEFGETLEACAIRETKEETDLDIENPEFVAITNDIFEEENKHYLGVFMKAQHKPGDIVRDMEPEKSESWNWYDMSNLPPNLFLPLKNLMNNNSYGAKLVIPEPF